MTAYIVKLNLRPVLLLMMPCFSRCLAFPFEVCFEAVPSILDLVSVCLYYSLFHTPLLPHPIRRCLQSPIDETFGKYYPMFIVDISHLFPGFPAMVHGWEIHQPTGDV
ncbi:hypothetical protein SODALDRAFT_55400 [Sodiomyces alkalinus F11]|uniref:Secreted protein n=1 Tax=Sodiomyces alkalinus (strain CBS 110278 / VKM F-3762 / F11) TaxID=1314773 RepID=A0A3N2PN69_SODAK|nr:hypothetical protein SODALDRAFT_55400 [Sodiomyces alkalinus F11]ROT35968.1 hypothetical protein SODALDRAFT_55400 [Sodiomyces alkalinus F11]